MNRFLVICELVLFLLVWLFPNIIEIIFIIRKNDYRLIKGIYLFLLGFYFEFFGSKENDFEEINSAMNYRRINISMFILIIALYLNNFRKFGRKLDFWENIFCPITEEIIYKKIFLEKFYGKIGKNKIMFYGAFMFSISHTLILILRKANFMEMIIVYLYTYVYYLITFPLYLEKKGIILCIIYHMFFNYFGLPEIKMLEYFN